MSAACCCTPAPDPHRGNATYRRVLWTVLVINAVMFVVEIGAGLAAGSASLQADALDFLGDAGNYIISLAVLSMALRYRAMAALAIGYGAFSAEIFRAGIQSIERGQTEAAHDICPNIPVDERYHYVQPGVGHYGVFNGTRWRTEIQPRIREMIRNVQFRRRLADRTDEAA